MSKQKQINMQKLIIKIIYFLLKYLKSEISSFEQFNADAAKVAGDRYFSVKIEKSTHKNSKGTLNFTVYVDGFSHFHGATPKEALKKAKEAVSGVKDKGKTSKVEKIVD